MFDVNGLWVVKAGNVEVVVCRALAATVMLGALLPVQEGKGTAQMKNATGQWESFIFPSHITSVVPWRGMDAPKCDGRAGHVCQ